MKQLKFAKPLPQKVLDGEKDTTWRIDDEKEITVNDKLSLQTTAKEEFGKAEVLWTKMTTFGRLTEEDKEGHESFKSKEEMHRTYEQYYNQKIGSETELKVIKFQLIDK
jgi:hypothetical protein